MGSSPLIAGMLARLARGEASVADLCAWAAELDWIDEPDDLIETIAALDPPTVRALRPHAQWLLRTGTDPDAVRLGAVLLGTTGTHRDVGALESAARRDDIGVYAVAAIDRLLDDPADALIRIAEDTAGWSRVEAVTRLAAYAPLRPDVAGWLLRHGCANAIFDEHVALPCAEAARLADALATVVDADALDGACRIMRALIASPAGPGLGAYDDAPEALERLVGILLTECTTLERLNTVADVIGWLEGPGADALDEALHTHLAAACRSIIDRPGWPSALRYAFVSGDRPEMARAWRIAPLVHVDLWEAAFTHLDEIATDEWLFFCALQTRDPARAARVLQFAERRLPLYVMACDPTAALGPGDAHRPYRLLDMTLQRIAEGDCWSASLVRAGLHSAVSRTRHLAARAAGSHPEARRGDSLRAAIAAAAAAEPDPDLQALLAALT